MEISYIIGFLVMWACLLIARSISNKEIRLLDDEMKARLIDLATERRGMQIAIMVAGIGAFYVISLLIDSNREIWFGLYALFIVVWIIYRFFAGIRKYREAGFNQTFVQAQVKAGIIRIIGITAFFAIFGLNFLLNKQHYEMDPQQSERIEKTNH